MSEAEPKAEHAKASADGAKTRSKGILSLISMTWADIFKNEILTRANAIAFAAMMAAVPFLALVLTIVAYSLPDPTDPGTIGLGNQIINHLEVLLGTVFPDQASKIFEEQISRLQAQPIAALSVSLVITLWLASNLFASIIDGLNRIYGVEESRPYWKLRLIAAFMTIVQSIILLVAVGAIFAWPIVVDWAGFTWRVAWIATLVKWLIVFLMVLTSFALTFFVGPDVTQSHKWVTPGSVFGAIVFLVATYGFRYYVQHLAQYDAMYGSLGGVMIVMFWFWINSLVLLLAAQLNKVCHYAKQWCQGCTENSQSGSSRSMSSSAQHEALPSLFGSRKEGPTVTSKPSSNSSVSSDAKSDQPELEHSDSPIREPGS